MVGELRQLDMSGARCCLCGKGRGRSRRGSRPPLTLRTATLGDDCARHPARRGIPGAWIATATWTSSTASAKKRDQTLRMERAVKLARLVREYHVGVRTAPGVRRSARKGRCRRSIAARHYDVLVLGNVRVTGALVGAAPISKPAHGIDRGRRRARQPDAGRHGDAGSDAHADSSSRTRPNNSL